MSKEEFKTLLSKGKIYEFNKDFNFNNFSFTYNC